MLQLKDAKRFCLFDRVYNELIVHMLRERANGQRSFALSLFAPSFLHGSHNMNYIGYIEELYRHIQKER